MTINTRLYQYRIGCHVIRFAAESRQDAHVIVTQEIGPCVAGNLSLWTGCPCAVSLLEWKAVRMAA